MKLNRVREWCKSSDLFKLIPLGDFHLGSANCDKERLLEVIAEVNGDPNARWIGMGDYAEWITPNDKRWDEGGVDTDILTLGDVGQIGDIYVDYLVNLLRPIIDKCWAFGIGNHESAFQKYKETNIAGRILKALDRPKLYTGWAAFTKAAFQTKNSKNQAVWLIYHSHGWQAGRRPGAKANQLELIASYFDADICLQGHSHERLVAEFVRLGVTHGFKKLQERKILAAHTGCFLKTYEQDTVGYGEKAGYRPTALGPIRIILRPGTCHAEKRAEMVL